jgi:hypothetical protein
MCGQPLLSVVNQVRDELALREGFSLNYAHYLGGFHGHAERTRFSREVCGNCADLFATKMEPVLRFIKDKECGR